MQNKPFLCHIFDLLDIVADCIYNTYLLKYYGVHIGKKTKIKGRIKIKAEKNGKICIGENCILNSGSKNNLIGAGNELSFWIKNGEICIGNNVGISNVGFVSDKKIIIEDDVFVGGGTIIYDTDFHSLKLKERLKHKDDRDIHCEEVTIKEGAFIGANVIILKGVTIGRESIIGAGSVVTRAVPDYEIWAGNPAKFIRKIYD